MRKPNLTLIAKTILLSTTTTVLVSCSSGTGNEGKSNHNYGPKGSSSSQKATSAKDFPSQGTTINAEGKASTSSESKRESKSTTATGSNAQAQVGLNSSGSKATGNGNFNNLPNSANLANNSPSITSSNKSPIVSTLPEVSSFGSTPTITPTSSNSKVIINAARPDQENRLGQGNGLSQEAVDASQTNLNGNLNGDLNRNPSRDSNNPSPDSNHNSSTKQSSNNQIADSDSSTVGTSTVGKNTSNSQTNSQGGNTNSSNHSSISANDVTSSAGGNRNKPARVPPPAPSFSANQTGNQEDNQASSQPSGSPNTASSGSASTGSIDSATTGNRPPVVSSPSAGTSPATNSSTRPSADANASGTNESSNTNSANGTNGGTQGSGSSVAKPNTGSKPNSGGDNSTNSEARPGNNLDAFIPDIPDLNDFFGMVGLGGFGNNGGSSNKSGSGSSSSSSTSSDSGSSASGNTLSGGSDTSSSSTTNSSSIDSTSAISSPSGETTSSVRPTDGNANSNSRPTSNLNPNPNSPLTSAGDNSSPATGNSSSASTSASTSASGGDSTGARPIVDINVGVEPPYLNGMSTSQPLNPNGDSDSSSNSTSGSAVNAPSVPLGSDAVNDPGVVPAGTTEESPVSKWTETSLSTKQEQVERPLSDEQIGYLSARMNVNAETYAFINKRLKAVVNKVDLNPNSMGLLSLGEVKKASALIDERVAKILILDSTLSHQTKSSANPRLSVSYLHPNPQAVYEPNPRTAPFSHGEMIINRLLSPPSTQYNYYPSFFSQKGKVHFLGFREGQDEVHGQYHNWIDNPKTRELIHNGYSIVNISFGHFSSVEDVSAFYNRKFGNPFAAQKILNRRNNNILQAFNEMGVLRGKSLETTVNTLNGYARDYDANIVLAMGNFANEKYNMDVLLAESRPNFYKSLLDSYLVVTSYNALKEDNFYTNTCIYAQEHCLVAPGRNHLITNSNYNPESSWASSNYGREKNPVVQGTSFAAPYVAAVVGLVKSIYPFLYNRGVQQTILTTAKPLHHNGGYTSEVFGWGLIQPSDAIHGPKVFQGEDFLVDFNHNSKFLKDKDNFTFSNDIRGEKGLIIKGSQKENILTLKGYNTYSGSTVVGAHGRLNLEGPLRKSSLYIKDRGEVFASSSLQDVTNSGTFHAFAYGSELDKPILVKGKLVSLALSKTEGIINLSRQNGIDVTEYPKGISPKEYLDSPLIEKDYYQNPDGTLSLYLGQPLIVKGQVSLFGTLRVEGVKRAILGEKGMIFDEVLLSQKPIRGKFNRVEFNSPLLEPVYNLEKVTYDHDALPLYSYILKTHFKGLGKALADGSLGNSDFLTKQGAANLDLVASHVFRADFSGYGSSRVSNDTNFNNTYNNNHGYSSSKDSANVANSNSDINNDGYLNRFPNGRPLDEGRKEADSNTRVSSGEGPYSSSYALAVNVKDKEKASSTESANSSSENVQASSESGTNNNDSLGSNTLGTDSQVTDNQVADKKETLASFLGVKDADLATSKAYQEAKERASAKEDNSPLDDFVAALVNMNDKEDIKESARTFSGQSVFDFYHTQEALNQDLFFNFLNAESNFTKKGSYGNATFSSYLGNHGSTYQEHLFMGYQGAGKYKVKFLASLDRGQSTSLNNAKNTFATAGKGLTFALSAKPFSSFGEKFEKLEVGVRGGAFFNKGNLSEDYQVLSQRYNSNTQTSIKVYNFSLGGRYRFTLKGLEVQPFLGYGYRGSNLPAINKDFGELSLVAKEHRVNNNFLYAGLNVEKNNFLMDNLSLDVSYLLTKNFSSLDSLPAELRSADNKEKVALSFKDKDRGSLAQQGGLTLSYNVGNFKLSLFANYNSYNSKNYSIGGGIKARIKF